MRAEVNHDFQLGHERFEALHVAVGARHFHRHRRLRLELFDADGFGLQDSTERPGA